MGVLLAYLGLMGGGVYFVINRMKRGRIGGLGNRNRGGIALRGSHMLGNRQFLVVAEVEGKRMLLGVGPGFISHLSDLTTAEASGADTEPLHEEPAAHPREGSLSGFAQLLGGRAWNDPGRHSGK